LKGAWESYSHISVPHFFSDLLYSDNSVHMQYIMSNC